MPFFWYLPYTAGTPKLKWNQRWSRVAKTVKCWHILKDNSANLLHTGDNKNANKWIDDIRCIVMVFDVTYVRENRFWRHRNGVSQQQHLFLPTLHHCRILGGNKVNIIFNDGNYFINKVSLKCWPKLLFYSISLLVIRNKPQNVTSLTENISQICIILLNDATCWWFNRLTCT